ncbi:MAG: ATP synthase subunit I [Deltaproteobacteria bacterium]|nr:ATP synthase subunit I [Deltaproteobacteria bacterium]
MTVEAILLGSACLLWGAFLGLFYFGGLWMTLKTTLGKPRPEYRLAASLIVRLAVALAGFWLVMRMELSLFFFTLAGFFLVRIVLTRVLGRGNGGRYHAAYP